jgi:hypothetical protein
MAKMKRFGWPERFPFCVPLCRRVTRHKLRMPDAGIDVAAFSGIV